MPIFNRTTHPKDINQTHQCRFQHVYDQPSAVACDLSLKLQLSSLKLLWKSCWLPEEQLTQCHSTEMTFCSSISPMVCNGSVVKTAWLCLLLHFPDLQVNQSSISNNWKFETISNMFSWPKRLNIYNSSKFMKYLTSCSGSSRIYAVPQLLLPLRLHLTKFNRCWNRSGKLVAPTVLE